VVGNEAVEEEVGDLGAEFVGVSSPAAGESGDDVRGARNRLWKEFRG
jgi:hypothetical protein